MGKVCRDWPPILAPQGRNMPAQGNALGTETQ
jgi:hypothetical protein